MRKFVKENWGKALFFILGVIVTILITKFFDKILPNEPTIVKEVTDTITLVHNYVEPKESIDPIVINEKIDVNLKKRNINFKETNSLENIEIPTYNLNIELNKPIKIDDKSWKGYVQGDISSYSIIECPDPNSKLLMFNIGMLNNDLLNDIAFFQCKIYKVSGDKYIYVSDNYYEVKRTNNTIGIVNNLDKGSFVIEIGFMFKDDLNNEYPKFYRKKCYLDK